MIKQRIFVLSLLAMLLAGCATLGVEAPQTFNDRLAYAYGNVKAMQSATVKALDAQQITSADASEAQKRAKEALVLLDAARTTAAAGDVSTAEGRLKAGLSALDTLTAYLNARGVNP